MRIFKHKLEMLFRVIRKFINFLLGLGSNNATNAENCNKLPGSTTPTTIDNLGASSHEEDVIYSSG